MVQPYQSVELAATIIHYNICFQSQYIIIYQSLLIRCAQNHKLFIEKLVARLFYALHTILFPFIVASVNSLGRRDYNDIIINVCDIFSANNLLLMPKSNFSDSTESDKKPKQRSDSHATDV